MPTVRKRIKPAPTGNDAGCSCGKQRSGKLSPGAADMLQEQKSMPAAS